MDTIEYRTLDWAFTVTFSRLPGSHEARLTGRSPASMQPKKPGTPIGMMRSFPAVSFNGETRAEAKAAAEQRIIEVGGEILSKNPDDDEV